MMNFVQKKMILNLTNKFKSSNNHKKLKKKNKQSKVQIKLNYEKLFQIK